jgi:hypothetical protein
MAFNIPEPLKVEHDELQARLAEATAVPGRIGDAARAVAELLHPHFLKEEEYALPPLGLLPRLAVGEVRPEMAQVLALTERLKAELPQMLDEHKGLAAALHRLVEAAKQAGQMEYAGVAEQLVLHAQTEEAVLYPAAILVGEYVKRVLKA